jgi:Ulp1 family protease
VGIKYKILNSFFAQTTFSKSNEMIERALKRKQIDKSHILLIAINNGNHWFFAKIRNSKIMIYDSIRKDK